MNNEQAIKALRTIDYNVQMTEVEGNEFDQAIEYAIIALSNPMATISMSPNRFSITVREDDAIIKLIKENQELRQRIKELEQ